MHKIWLDSVWLLSWLELELYLQLGIKPISLLAVHPLLAATLLSGLQAFEIHTQLVASIDHGISDSKGQVSWLTVPLPSNIVVEHPNFL